MKTVGIVAEYNPFHLGHAWHIAESRRMASDGGEESAVIAVMSGDFVQRGEAAAFSKYARAEAACRSGADLVVELPLPWALSSAERFAEGAVQLLSELGAQTLSFGSESGNLESLRETAELLSEADFHREIRSRLREKPAQSYAAARQELAEERLGKKLPEMNRPNDILALEYLKAIRKKKLSLRAAAVRRKGAGHDREEEEAILSAYDLRKRLAAGQPTDAWLPEASAEVCRREKEAGRVVCSAETENLLMLSRLRGLKAEQLERLPYAGGGLAVRLHDAIRRSGSYEEILRRTATRRYPLARIRRLCCCAVLGITEDAATEKVPYARILAFNRTGREYLREITRQTQLPVLVKPAGVHELGEEAKRIFELTSQAHDFYTLFYPSGTERLCGEDWRRGPSVCS